MSPWRREFLTPEVVRRIIIQAAQRGAMKGQEDMIAKAMGRD